MSIHDEIRMAQVKAGENVVIARLKRMGLINEEGEPIIKKEKSNVIPFKKENTDG